MYYLKIQIKSKHGIKFNMTFQNKQMIKSIQFKKCNFFCYYRHFGEDVGYFK